MEILRSVGWFLVAIAILVAFHEYGHFWVARKLGVKVLRFSVGFGKVLWSRKGADGCEYALSAVPLGGYVKMLDEREGEVAPEELHLAFNRAAAWRRLLIVAAGPAANLLLAIVFFWAVFVIGQPGLRPVIAAPPAESVAAKAGLAAGELITAVDGAPVATWTQLRTLLLEAAVDHKPLTLSVAHSLEDASSRSVAMNLAKVRIDPEVLFVDLGLSPFQPLLDPVLAEIEPGSAADQAGFKVGDRILSHDGEPVADFGSWAKWIRAHPAVVSIVSVQRGGTTLTLKPLIGSRKEGETLIGRIGAGAKNLPGQWKKYETDDRLGPIAAVPAAFAETWRMSTLTLKMFGRMFTGEVSVKNVSGPIQIAEAAGFTASIGVAAFLSFMALVSVSLAVLNLLPVPVLDGGHLVFYAYEMIRGEPVPEKFVQMGQRVGITLLVMLMGLAFYNDLSRVFSAFKF